MKRKTNGGFSLVELIIVIAIMAILVGVITPQLLKYIEKSRVASDEQLCDEVRSAILTTMTDPKIINSSDPKTQILLEQFTSPNENRRLDSYGGASYQDSDFVQNVTNICGFNPFAPCDTYHHLLKSTPAHTNGIICIQTSDSGSGFWIFIAHSDKSGEKQDNNALSIGDLNQVICAPSVE